MLRRHGPDRRWTRQLFRRRPHLRGLWRGLFASGRTAHRGLPEALAQPRGDAPRRAGPGIRGRRWPRVTSTTTSSSCSTSARQPCFDAPRPEPSDQRHWAL
ncbi:hypothetical protein N865_20740 [Intrasporangium oryzae NRRL B-24470]|uniref:Uncharacterized protein n=1 Tax=Intrasporangium oryzae NRRL B-24470 TaxID=1386089 RepID=W9G1I6_9MICO|nr:hypothetical protein N865_20740 [Intrasporangium oryzae NRRL B-24470]